MVAITVILAAVIATFVLGLGDQISNTAPQASFSFDYDTSVSGSDSFGTSAGSADGFLSITHDGGDTIEAANLNINGGVNSQTWSSASGASTEISAGSGVEYAVEDSDTVRVTYQSSSGDSSATLGRWEGPQA